MKKLYIVYWSNPACAVPFDKHFVCVGNCGMREIIESIKLNAYNMAVFFGQFPNGKVEHVWE